MTTNTTNGPSLNGGPSADSQRLSDELLAVLNLSPEMKEKRIQMLEASVEPWRHLVRRQHAWRMQLYIKGRNMTARQLVGWMLANQFDEKGTAENHHLPVEAVREALTYVNENKELIETETEIERLMLKRGEVARGPQSIP